MVLNTQTKVEQIAGRAVETREPALPAQDVSGGVESPIGDVNSFTVYLDVAGPVDITIELTPDGGSNWYEPSESPVSFAEAGQEAIRMTYSTDRVRITGSDTTDVQAQIQEVV